MTEDEARIFCSARCEPNALAQLERFVEMLGEENSRQNLVSKASLEHVWSRHIADGLQLLDHVPRETSPWLDLGSGAGFPGLAVAIARPDVEVVLVESRKRRVEWLREVCAEFALDKCRVVGSRLENVDDFPAAVITARAFAPLEKLLNLSTRFSTRSTVWLLPKGSSAAQELSGQSKSVQSMFHVEQSATDSSAAILLGHGRPPIS